MGMLAISVRLHDGRYHGVGDWPPAPARLFQALIAGAGLGGPPPEKTLNAMGWLQGRMAPVIGVPYAWRSRSVLSYMPNNDSDRIGGDPLRISEIRTATKVSTPWLFDSTIPFIYIWQFEGTAEDERYCQTICTLAERLYQFGRGVDMAWAWGEILDEAEFENRLATYPGRVLRPSVHGRGITLPCPQRGSLESLQRRYEAYARRFAWEGTGKNAKRSFTQPPKARFAQVAYEAKSDRRVYDLRKPESDTSFAPWPLAMAAALVTKIRDRAVERLHKHLPEKVAHVDASLVGRKADGSDAGPTSARIRIVPLPSIGHAHADLGIRRVMVDVPADCPLGGDDVHWAFSGLGIDLVDPNTGEVSETLLIRSDDEGMLSKYVGRAPGSRLWRTVTPIALPAAAGRRRIEPKRRLAEAKTGDERAGESTRAAAAIAQALRHAGVRACDLSVRVQREPFTGHGERAERFAPGTRFPKEQLWHAEIMFEQPVEGPLVIGNGRFLGLGVMEPNSSVQGLHAFDIVDGLVLGEAPEAISRALRRAVMARVQETIGQRKSLPPFFTGHHDDGSPARSESEAHLSCVFDPMGARLLVIAPHLVERREPSREEISNLQTLTEALAELRELRAGRAGKLTLKPTVVDADDDPLFGTSRVWKTATPYLVNRHLKGANASEVLRADLSEECRRRGLPEPEITSSRLRGVPGMGLLGDAQITFKVAVNGPIILGRGRHFGLGLFIAVSPG